MEVLIFVALAAIIFGAKVKAWGDKKWEDRNKPRIITHDRWLEDNMCDRLYEQTIREEYPPQGEVTEERLALVRDVASDILLGRGSRFTEKDLEEQTKILAQKYIVNILLVKKQLIPCGWTSWTSFRDHCGERVFLWGFRQLQPYCKDLRVIADRGREVGILPPDLQYSPGDYYACPEQAFLARTENTTW